MTMKQRRSRRRILLLSFFVPLFALLCLFVQRGIFPFGEESFLRTDLYHQYAPFFSEFQYKLQHGPGYSLMATSIIQLKHFMRVG